MSEDERTRKANALMDTLQRDDVGRLTVFLGAAPGVGKTYAMLTRARERIRSGAQLLAAVVETHGRSETVALLEGLPQLPRQRVHYQGHVFEELDLDGLLSRKPQIALIDELAHRNTPGCRHERRWQDVVEVLDAGIDVYTTINIQHLESLNDIVFAITGVRVSETVPDALFDRLRDIVLIDLPARELIERLRQGKVYLPDQATHALQAFFSPSNLSALRELAMQTAADQIDSDRREVETAGKLTSHSGLRRRVIVAIDGSGSADYLVRLTRRISERRHIPWIVVAVQTHAVSSAEWQLEIDRAFTLAHRLGGETALLHSHQFTDALLDFAAHNGASTLVLGRSRHSWLAHLLQSTPIQQILRRATQYEIVVVSARKSNARQHISRRPTFSDTILRRDECLLATCATAAALILAWLMQRFASVADVSLIFMVAVILVATRTRMTATVLTALFSFFVYNFFLIEPRFTLRIQSSRSLVTICLFLITALITGRLASRLHNQVIALRAANAHAKVLQDLGRRLGAAADLKQVLIAGHQVLAHALEADAWLRLGQQASEFREDLSELDHSAINWTQRHGQPSGRYTDTLAGARWWCLPLGSEQGPRGVIALRFIHETPRLTIEQRRLAEALVENISEAALRTVLVADLEQARMSIETERLRSALLSSVSHDLRSPLASMIGSATSLTNYGHQMNEVDRTSLLTTIVQEGERLDRYIQNLLDMTRLGHTGLTLKRDWIGIDELIGSAVRRIQRYQPQLRIALTIDAELPPILVHPALVEQALFNVLENAATFSPADEEISVLAHYTEQRLHIDITDRGPGIPQEERDRIFDMFYSVERGDRGHHGTGLGLTICKGLIGAHGGSVTAFPGPNDRGTLIRLTLPYLQPPSRYRGELTAPA